MTTIKDIQDGNYCENCDANCRLFVYEADCCLYDTFISRLAVKVGTENLNKEVQYDAIKSKGYILTIENPDNLDKLNIIKNKM